MKHTLLLLLISCGFALSAQQSDYIKIKVVDAQSGKPIERVSVYRQSVKGYLFTDDSGRVTINQPLPVTLKLTHIAYNDLIVTIKESEQTLSMSPASIPVDEIDVLPKLPEFLFFGTKESHIIDYAFWGNHTLIALYNFHKKRCYVLLLGPDQTLIDEQPLPANFEQFYQNAFNRYYAITADKVFELTPSTTRIGIAEISSELFYKKIVFYAGYHKQYFYLQAYNREKQTKFFMIEDSKSPHKKDYPIFYAAGSNKKQTIANMQKQELSNLYQKRMNDIFPNYQPGEGDITGGSETSHTETKESFGKASAFTQQYQNKPISAPFFLIDTTIFIFDFEQEIRVACNVSGEMIGQTPLSFFKLKNTTQEILLDNKTFYSYSTSKEGTTELHRLNTVTCETEFTKPVFYQHIERLKVYNGYVYYLKTMNDRARHVYLFREKVIQ